MNIYLQILFTFMKVALLSFGGGYASLPLVEEQVVFGKGWLTPAEFANLLALDEFTPGPIIINSATFVGMKVAGVPGALMATLGSVLPCFVLSLTLIWLYRRFQEIPIIGQLLGALKCMALALITSTFLNILLALVFPAGIAALQINFYSIGMIFAAMLMMRKLQLSPVVTMIICGAANMLLHLLMPAATFLG